MIFANLTAYCLQNWCEMVLLRFVVGFALDYALWFGLFSLPDNASYLGSSDLRGSVFLNG